ncbi:MULTISPECIES: hypothetical protein [Anaerostipes]|uniref:hypothetical protein n=1 Tax=Anaerostipes TaxID=207244 RepID=UPI0013011605|nr:MULTISPECIES: hypothetical protein [Anaerostipes]MCI5623980.1 hypothetical protein [Anaerostipes sp.]MDY2727300.1 hypothetical protein [Anaerostipes faecalis]
MGYKRYADRAKQFASFDALKGFREALKKEEQLMEQKSETTVQRIKIEDSYKNRQNNQ